VIKVVFLDWYGTLCQSHFFEHWADSNHPYGCSYQAIQEWFRDPASSEFQRAWMVGEKLLGDWIALVSQITGLDGATVEAELIESMRGWCLIDPGTLDLVGALQSKGVRVVIASDNMDGFETLALPQMGLSNAFDGVLNSAVLGCQKGDPDEFGRSRFFVPFLEAGGIGPGESVLIDDSEDVASVLEQTGIQFLHSPFGTGPTKQLSDVLARQGSFV
jgi:FMN phosphatase YigB (HAD superfamily)